jgi:hypothetical protein
MLVTYVNGLTFLPLWLSSHSDYSPTAPAAPFLRPCMPSGSLIRCQSVQVYPHHPAVPIGGGSKSSESGQCFLPCLQSLLSFRKGLTPSQCPVTYFLEPILIHNCSLYDFQTKSLSDILIECPLAS